MGFIPVFRYEDHILLFGHRACPRDLDRQPGRSFETLSRQVVGGRETPCAPVECTDPDAQRNGTGKLADFSVLGRDMALLGLHQPHVGVTDAAAHGGV